ncbi:DegV family protein [Barrientosiimonas marina]|uniref:DegV family protein n=1 Tax=Lentibacillus kimchii TaxID=1542911 RepID=A0ABW2UUM5_9BACI
MTVKILADSACDLSEDYYNRYNIEMIPLTVHLDDQEYQDGVEIKPTTVYHAMREGKTPKTSQVSPHLFRQIFTSYAEADQPFIYPAFSSELSGTYQTAKMVEQEIKETYPNAKMQVIDTKCASIGCGLVVLRAAQLAQNGSDFDRIIEAVTYHAEHMEHIFTVDDLEYLYRGGRVSKTAAFVGSFLKIKPILHVEDGLLVPLEKQRGSKKLFNRMLTIMEERGTDFSSQTVGISHADDLETAREIAASIREKFNPADILIDMVGATIGAHAGPGTIAIFFLNDHYN